MNKMPGKTELKNNWTKAVSRWSYSKLAVYESCPKAFYYSYIAKLKPFVTVPAMERGKKIHTLAEDFVLGDLKKLPKELKVYEKEFIELRNAGGTEELDFSFTREWIPTVWNDWGAVWCISKLDSTCKFSDSEMAFVDYKTGKVYDTHTDQSDVYALSSFIQYPDVDFVTGEFWYLDQPDEEPLQKEYTRENDFKALQSIFNRRVNKMVNDKRFNRKPSYKCSWCDFNISKGGPCDPG